MRQALRPLSSRALLPLGVLALLALPALAAAPGCSDQPLPGTDYGRYKVTGQTSVNSCGQGLDEPDPWVFDAEVSRDGAMIYWSWLDDSAPLSGPLVSSHASITTNQSANVDSNDAGAGPCTMTRNDDLELNFATGTPPASFSGTISYSFSVPSGSTCADQLTSGGGTYATLPCTLTYTITAARQ